MTGPVGRERLWGRPVTRPGRPGLSLGRSHNKIPAAGVVFGEAPKGNMGDPQGLWGGPQRKRGRPAGSLGRPEADAEDSRQRIRHAA